jgi:hypothetical protein
MKLHIDPRIKWVRRLRILNDATILGFLDAVIDFIHAHTERQKYTLMEFLRLVMREDFEVFFDSDGNPKRK